MDDYDIKVRLVRLNESTLSPGEFVLMGARHMDVRGRIATFPCQLEFSVNGGVDWQLVEFVNSSLVDDEVQR